jgi:hypothetical protein
MKTKIGTSFGLAIMVAIGVIAAMLALGLFSGTDGFRASKLSADVGGAHVAPTVTLASATAGATTQYTILATGAAAALAVGDSITVTFNSSTTVPSSILATNTSLKANTLTGGGTANQLVTPSAVSVTGRAVTLTIPDMDQPSVSNGDQGIAAQAGITITFKQAAGITNPNLAKTVGATVPYTVDVHNSTDTAKQTSAAYAITMSVTFTPAKVARDGVVAVTGKGFTSNCTVCNIRLNPQNVVAPTTGSANSLITFDGTGSIDANGVFTGTFTASATTTGDLFVWVTDGAGASQSSTTAFVQNAGATPRSPEASAGSTVTVDLVDFNKAAGTRINNNTTFVGAATNLAVNAASGSLPACAGTPAGGSAAAGPFEINCSATSGNSLNLNPYKFVVPAATATGSHVVTITDTGGTPKTATFTLEVISRSLVVTPNEASPGQAFSISGTAFSTLANTTIAINALTITGVTILNPAAVGAITVNPDGTFLFTGTVPTADATVLTTGAKTFTAIDSTGLVGTSSGFKLTARTLTVPGSAAPGSSVVISGTGMTVGTGASVTITSSGVALPATIFPIQPDGTFSGVIVIPTTQGVATITITATDNAAGVPALSATNKVATASLKIAGGTLTVTPDKGSTGTAVSIEGSGWPLNQSLSVLTIGGGSALSGGATDGQGNFSIQTTVPAAALGGSLIPGATVVSVTVGTVTVSTPFTVASPSVSNPDSAIRGESIAVTLTGFNALAPLTILNIGNATALPAPSPVMDGQGNATANVTIPALNPGTYNITVQTGTAPGVIFVGTGTITITSSPVVTTPETSLSETVFADELESGNLVIVWRFKGSDQSWDFFREGEAFRVAPNFMTEIVTGDIVWIKVTEETTFQGKTLFAGWNQISLN